MNLFSFLHFIHKRTGQFYRQKGYIPPGTDHVTILVSNIGKSYLNHHWHRNSVLSKLQYRARDSGFESHLLKFLLNNACAPFC